jgi:uncharacterized membrane protein
LHDHTFASVNNDYFNELEKQTTSDIVFITCSKKILMPNKTSQHILGTSANLLGFCLIVITSLRIAGKTKNTMVDEFTSIVALLLAISIVLSFISMRTTNENRERIFETTADILFLFALTGIIVIIAFITITFWNK